MEDRSGTLLLTWLAEVLLFEVGLLFEELRFILVGTADSPRWLAVVVLCVEAGLVERLLFTAEEVLRSVAVVCPAVLVVRVLLLLTAVLVSRSVPALLTDEPLSLAVRVEEG